MQTFESSLFREQYIFILRFISFFDSFLFQLILSSKFLTGHIVSSFSISAVEGAAEV